MRRLFWAVLSAFIVGALIAFAISLVRRPPQFAGSGYEAPTPVDGPTAA